MKQGNKIVSCIILLSIVFIMMQTVSLFGLYHISFRTVEKIVARKNLQFCINSLQAELSHLNGLCFEWSAWDDTGLFLEGQKLQYIGENTTEITLREKKLDVLCFLDTSGNIVWNRFVKNSGNEFRNIHLEMFSPENLQKNPSLWKHQSVDNCVYGFCSTENGVLMISSRPVTNNTNSPPIHGTVILGRFISDQMIASIARQTCLDFKWWNLHSDYTRQAMDKYLSQINSDNPIFIDIELGSAAAYTILQDINKKDAILVKFLMTNDLTVCRDELMLKSAGVFVAEGFVILLCLALIVNSLCDKYLNPVSSVLPDMSDITIKPILTEPQNYPEKETVTENMTVMADNELF